MVYLTPDVVVLIVHPIDTQVHQRIPAGWRWAVQVGQGPFSDMDRCANAGWAPSHGDAMAEGEQVAVAVVKALRMAGHQAAYRIVETPVDPIPPGGDKVFEFKE